MNGQRLGGSRASVWRKVEDRSEVEWGGEVECEVECGGEGAGKINNSSTTQLTLLLLNTFFS